MTRTTKLPIPFHPHATDEDITEAIAGYMRECRVAAVPGAWRIIIARLRNHYGTKLVDRAVHRYTRALRQENGSLLRQARAANLKRKGMVEI